MQTLRYSPKADLKRFFEILDTKEESDSGTIFNPTVIRSCRTMAVIELDPLLKRLKEYANKVSA